MVVKAVEPARSLKRIARIDGSKQDQSVVTAPHCADVHLESNRRADLARTKHAPSVKGAHNGLFSKTGGHRVAWTARQRPTTIRGRVGLDQLVPAVIGASAGVLTTLITVIYGPIWKLRLDRRRDRRDRSDLLIAEYAEPLGRAAFDLQSRLYNILCRQFLTAYFGKDDYAELSTLWLFGQYLAWAEILRREVQLVEFGDVKRTATFQLHLATVTSILASDMSIEDPVFNLFRTEQRAIGELMVVERTVAGQHRSDSMGYAAFKSRLQNESFGGWFEKLRSGISALAANSAHHVRPIYLQRALIDLIDFLDPQGLRFPEKKNRSYVPLPAGVVQQVYPVSGFRG